MCKYCEDISDDGWNVFESLVYSIDGDVEIKIKGGTYYLCFSSEDGFAEVVINYCPMCGRDLKGE